MQVKVLHESVTKVSPTFIIKCLADTIKNVRTYGFKVWSARTLTHTRLFCIRNYGICEWIDFKNLPNSYLSSLIAQNLCFFKVTNSMSVWLLMSPFTDKLSNKNMNDINF